MMNSLKNQWQGISRRGLFLQLGWRTPPHISEQLPGTA
jgi:hypothetical protein